MAKCNHIYIEISIFVDNQAALKTLLYHIWLNNVFSYPVVELYNERLAVRYNVNTFRRLLHI